MEIIEERVKKINKIVAEFGEKYVLLGGTNCDWNWFANHVGPLVSLRDSSNIVSIDINGKRVWTRKPKLG